MQFGTQISGRSAAVLLLGLTAAALSWIGGISTVGAQGESPRARWTLVETIINPDNAPFETENFHPLLEPRPDGRPHIDRAVVDIFDTAAVAANSMTFQRRQVIKSRVTGEEYGGATYSATFNFTSPPSELLEVRSEILPLVEFSGSYSATLFGETQRDSLVQGVTMRVSPGESSFLSKSLKVDEENPTGSEIYTHNLGLFGNTGHLSVFATILGCDACVVQWVFEREELDPDDLATVEPEPTEPVEEPTVAPTSISSGSPTTSRSDAALDDLLNTFGRMTQEVAEERIKNEIKINLEDLASWLGGQLESFLEASGGFLDDVYASLPDFAWEEQNEANAIPDEVEEQPDDPGGSGLTHEQLLDVLGKQVDIPTNVEFESGEELFDLVSQMLWSEDPESERFTRTRAAGGEIIELRRVDGTTVKTGVYVTPDGRVLYSTDGINYYPKLSDAIDPSRFTRGIETYNAMRNHVWQRLFEGSLRDKERQLVNDVSQEVLDEFRREMSGSSASSAPEDAFGDLKDPFKDIKGIGSDPYDALEGKATKSASDYLEGELWGPVTDTLKKKRDDWLWAAAEAALDNSVEFEARQNLKFILKEYQDLGNDALTAWEDMKKKAGVDLFELTGIGKKAAASGEFMVSAVQQMGKGLQDSDFGVRARQYILLRQEGKTPKQLWVDTRAGMVPELEFSTGRVTRSGLESTMAQQGIQDEVHLGLSFSLYEQAYQRVLLAQQLGRTP